MFGIHDFLLFLGAGLLLNITPGADMLYVLSNAARGSRAGLLAACGIFTGTLFHIAFAVAGLSALLAASATAFTVVKYVGAAYLVYLGAKMLLERSDKTGAVPDSPGQRSLLRTYRQGTLINLLNPKVALFFLAFLPQFIDTTNDWRMAAFLVLGLTFNCTSICVNGLLACTAARIGRQAFVARRTGHWLQKAAGVVFIGLGIRLALSRA